jgi:energy-coupling factor transporter transmembrane protein EcfT
MTWALYVYANKPRHGPTPFIECVLVPLYLILSFLSPTGPFGEFVGWAITILLMIVISYSIIWAAESVLKHGPRR